METHVISKSKYCSGTCFDPKKEEFAVSIRIIANSLYLDLKFKEGKRPEILINASCEGVYSHVILDNNITFNQFKELFSILSGHTFDFNVASWDDF